MACRLWKPTNRSLSQILVIILILAWVQVSSAERDWKFTQGKYESEHFTMTVPSAFLEDSYADDTLLWLSTNNGDISLAIIVTSNENLMFDRLAERVYLEDESYLASLLSADESVQVVNTLVQTARINRKDVEMLEFRFDIAINGKPGIAYDTTIKLKGVLHFCKIILISDKLSAATAKQYYNLLLDSLTTKEASSLTEGQWICGNCGAICTDNFCSKCGAKREKLASTGVIAPPSFEPTTDYADSNFATNTSDTTSAENGNATASTVATTPTGSASDSSSTSATPKNNSSDSYDDIVSIAKSLAGVLAYTASDPITGNTVSVNIEGKTILVHAEFKYAMDVFYEFYREYFDCIQHQDFQKMMLLSVEVEKVDAALEKIDDMELSDGDMAYYMSVYADILKVIGSVR